MSIDIIARMQVAFRTEASELLTELDSSLLSLEADPTNGEYVHRVFRAIHTIKGSGATVGLAHLAAVAHKVEEAFDLARSGRLPVTGELIDCGLKACDILRAILDAENPDAECPGERAVAEALALLLPKPDPNKQARPAPPVPAPSVPAPSVPSRAAYEVIVRPHRQIFFSGSDPMTLLDELRGLGQAHISCHAADVPLFFNLEPELCYLFWHVKLVTDRGEPAIREVFSFVEDECDVAIRLLEDQSSSVALLGAIPAESLDLFSVECQEHLEAIETGALELERDSYSPESLHAIFRAIHSIKGNAGVLLGQVPASSLEGSPLSLLARIAHSVESLLDPHRQNGGSPVPSSTVALVLETRDAMNGLLESLLGQTHGYKAPAELLEKLNIAPEPAGMSAAGLSAFQNTTAQCLAVIESCIGQLESGQSSRSLLKTYQRGLKTLAAAVTYQKRSDLEEPVAAQLRILDAAMGSGSEVSDDFRKQLNQLFQATRTGIMGESPAVADVPHKVAPAHPAATPTAAPAPAATIRIDQEKLDRLMRVVGELLVAKGAFPTLIDRITSGEDRTLVARALKDAGAGISHIAEELQDSVMAIRMLPVKSVFQRFPRLIRDLARTLGKEVLLVVEGESVELDKTILEQIGDPLVHLVRNAVDHGIERPEDRARHGKAAMGRLTLRAANEAGNVVIEVEDDGNGLNAEALKNKAVQNGLITREAANAMSAAEACRLVFLPGLSTAEKVTDVSGRGVGMDVVANNIRSLQGSVDIRSFPGKGTVFSIRLPTSLIVSKGILLQAGGEEYILPLTSIRDMVKVPAASLHDYSGLRMTQVRGEVYPVFSLADIFSLPVQPSDELSIALIESGTVRYGLLADRFVSEVEVLVKPLAGGLEECKEFHGAAILGDGRVVLVLNPLECHQMPAAGGAS